MDDKDKELIGNLGEIDTEYEKSQIEYNPVLKYEPKRSYSVTLPEAEESDEDSYSDADFGGEDTVYQDRNPITQYDDFVHLLDQITNIRYELESILSNTVIPLSELDMDRLSDSFPEIKINQEVDFDLYKNSFNNSEDPKNSLLQDIVQSYSEDVDGSLELEVYEDIREMEDTLLEVYYLFEKSILDEFDLNKKPQNIEEDEDFLEELKELMIEKEERHKGLREEYEVKESQYYTTLREEYGSPDYFRKLEEYEKAKRPYDMSCKYRDLSNEMMELIDESLFGYEELLGKIKIGLAIGSDINEEEVMKVLVKQKASKRDTSELLKLSQLALKLQVNKQIEEKKQYRDVLRNINNLSRKKRAHDELLTANKLRRDMYFNLYDSLRYLESPSRDSDVEVFFDQLAGGLELVSEEYDTFLSDMYRMYLSENEVRGSKLDKVLEKENARSGYRLVLNHQ